MYIIPANSKRALLFFGIFRLYDFVIFAVGCTITLILLFAMNSYNGLLFTAIKLAPAAIVTFLVLPVPNYHNVLVLIREIFDYYSKRKIYIWKGWCFSNEYKENRK